MYRLDPIGLLVQEIFTPYKDICERPSYLAMSQVWCKRMQRNELAKPVLHCPYGRQRLHNARSVCKEGYAYLHSAVVMGRESSRGWFAASGHIGHQAASSDRAPPAHAVPTREPRSSHRADRAARQDRSAAELSLHTPGPDG